MRECKLFIAESVERIWIAAKRFHLQISFLGFM